MANILWIEDDYERIKLLNYFLVKEGHIFISALNKKQALEILDKRKDIDLIILDLIIPEGEPVEEFKYYPGFKVLDKIVELKLNIPIIVLSIVRDSEVLSRLNKYNIVKILTKGVFKPSELYEAVNNVLEQQNKTE